MKVILFFKKHKCEYVLLTVYTIIYAVLLCFKIIGINESFNVMPIFLAFLSLLTTFMAIIIAISDKYIMIKLMEEKENWQKFIYYLFIPLIWCFLGIVLLVLKEVIDIQFIVDIIDKLSYLFLGVLISYTMWLLVFLYLSVKKMYVNEDTANNNKAEVRKEKE